MYRPRNYIVPFSRCILKDVPDAYEAQKIISILILHSFLGLVGIERMNMADSENDIILEINIPELNSYQYVHCISSATKRAATPWTRP